MGSNYIRLGELDTGIDYLQKALTMHRELGDRSHEASALGGIAYSLVYQGKVGDAIQLYQESVSIADEISLLDTQNQGRINMAEAYLAVGDLKTAREVIEAANQHRVPQNDHSVCTVWGVIALRQGDLAVAESTFGKAVTAADQLLAQTPQLFGALDAKAIALCGLAVINPQPLTSPLGPLSAGSEGEQYVEQAKAAFRAARTITKAKGNIASVLRLFDALVVADQQGVLKGVREVAAGESG
jgi:tetratricopeptide (TPR) repeat protein